jgi:hypothetical protein
MTAGECRHLLVVAAQCKAMEDLLELESAANSLVAVLADPEIGDCAPGLPDGRSLLLGRVDADEIWTAVRSAIEHAAANGAALIMAFLGHGLVSGEHATLHLMGWQSTEGVAVSAVNIKDLLGKAANQLGVRGVIAIIDTCNAAAAHPSIEELTTGARSGRTRIDLLMASAVQQSAYDLDFSKGLAKLLRGGVPAGGERLGVGVLTEGLRAEAATRRVIASSYDGDSSTPELWLARNRQAGGCATSAVGQQGTDELATGLLGLFPDREFPRTWTAAALRNLQREIGGLPATPAQVRVARSLDSLLLARQTVTFLHSFMPAGLNTPALRRAMATVGARSRRPLDGARDAVESIALNHPVEDGSCRSALARFVVALAEDTGCDLEATELRSWALGIDALIPYNDAVLRAREINRERRLRLVVRLDSPAGDWPESLTAWLLLDGAIHDHAVFTQCAASQAGAEAKLIEAVEWAEAMAEELDLRLQRIEVAVPSRIMLQWAPEAAINGTRLGVQYDVRTRWSIRLDPPAGMRWINKHAQARLSVIAAHDSGSSPITWLADHEVRPYERLRDELQNGRLVKPIGLLDCPRGDPELLDLLLSYAPILLWPDATGWSAEHCAQVVKRWNDLPAGFLAAYRARWTGNHSDPMADVRAIWDDDEWLAFCAGVKRHSHASPRRNR